ncbi:MAG: adenosylcobinamide-phosphate synthase CbiB [Actinomycetota bacterium]|nr:adenosylcobinamide-phosphate synthase CbiB [Actinomycetota bacterium]
MNTDQVVRRALAAAAGVALDRALGEPDIDPHPLAYFGRLMEAVERHLYRDNRIAGVAHVAGGVGLACAFGWLDPFTTTATSVAVGGRSLAEAAGAVDAALAVGDLVEARRLLPTLVGRDPEGLDGSEVARAVVESVAENTVDAVVAPVLWAVAAGGPGALGYRALNTLDAMVGHRSPRYERYGWASARLDDLANWVPARVTAVLVAAARPRSTRSVAHAVRHQAPAHPSPNAGVAEAAFAAALGLRLGGTNRYGGRVEHRPALGQGRPAAPADISRAVRLSLDVGVMLGTSLATAALVSQRSVTS